MSEGFLLAGTRDGGDSSTFNQNPSITNVLSSKLSAPIYVKVEVNNKRQHAIIDTGSAVTIINQQLLKKIHHKKFNHQRKIHQSANSTNINIIGDIELEIKVEGHKTIIRADVATNLVTDLLLGNDWISGKNVIIDTPQRKIIIIDQYRRTLATAGFIESPEFRLPVLLAEETTLPPYSERSINVKIGGSRNKITEGLFEPTDNLQSKQIFLTHAILKIKDNESRIMIMNTNNCHRTLSKHTRLGLVSNEGMNTNYLTLPVLTTNTSQKRMSNRLIDLKRNDTSDRSCRSKSQYQRVVQRRDYACGMNAKDSEDYECYVCHERHLTRNDLQKHLREKCYSNDIREQIDKLTSHTQNPNQRQRLENILWKYGKLFDLRAPSIIKATVQHAIETGNHPTVHTPPYRVSYKDEQIQRQEIEKLLKQNIIEESTSPWSSPIVLVRKKDGSVRFCIDFRKLNNITIKDAFPIPRIDDIFDYLSQAEYYTTIDFKSGYFQVGLDPKDRPKTAFSTRDQHYQFKVLPQGVTNGPPAFQRIVSQILGPTRWQYSLAYLDDVIIYSKNFDQHLVHLDDILSRLDAANFRLNTDKCQIAKTSINYLGHHVEHSNIRPNADNIRALLETPEPKTAKETFRFVKAAKYYRKFIPKFSMIAQPLYKYAPSTKEQRSKRSHVEVKLSDQEKHALHELKTILTGDLVLRIPNPDIPFKIQTDASKIGIGAVLMQTHQNGDLPIAYLSKKFTSTQMNWPATEQECYAIIFAIEKWHKYLDGRPFTIETDHKPLLPLNTKQQLNSKCERWRLKLQQYRFTVRYIKGKHNTIADYLSRSPVDDASHDDDDFTPTRSQATQTEDYASTTIVAPVLTRKGAKRQQQEEDRRQSADRSCEQQRTERIGNEPIARSCISDRQIEVDNQIIPFTYEDLKKLQHKDERIRGMIRNIEDYADYFVEDDMLMRKSSPPVPFVPSGRIRSDIIKIYHDTPANGAHFGRDKTIQKIQQRYFWPNMTTDIRNHLKSCIPCLQNNHQRQKPPGFLKPIKPPEGVWHLLTMDFHGPISPTTKQGNRYIIALTDVLSKFVITQAVRDCTASTAARFFTEEVILKYGTPKCILTDNGTHFTAAMMSELFKKIGVTHLCSTPYHPMTNGQVERYNATMDAKIAALSNEKRTNWDEQLPFVTFNYNTSIHTTTRKTPFEMMFGRSPTLPFDHQKPIVNLTQDPEHVQKLNQYLSSLAEDAKKNILRQQRKYKERYDRHRIDPTYKVNDLVLIKTNSRRNKFDSRYEGPFRIVEQVGPKTFIAKHTRKPTFVRQVTKDVVIPLFERRTIE